jgi:ketosteroid isomerase-like protein
MPLDSPFFAALLAADTSALDAVLTDDFILVDVMAGGVIGREALLAAIDSGTMTFTSIDRPTLPVTRHYGEMLAVTIGETRMTGTFAERSWSAHSRYTHVFVHDATAGWRLASAQGTPITGD